MKLPLRGFATTTALLSLAFILLVASSWYLRYYEGMAVGTTSRVEYEGSVTDIENGWKRYSNEYYHFSVDFPSSTPVSFSINKESPDGNSRISWATQPLNLTEEFGYKKSTTTLSMFVGEAGRPVDGEISYGIGVWGGYSVTLGGNSWIWQKEKNSSPVYPENTYALKAISTTHEGGRYKVLFMIHPVPAEDIQKYTTLLSKILITAQFADTVATNGEQVEKNISSSSPQTHSAVDSKDVRRIADLRQIQLALELYKSDNEHYPTQSIAGPVAGLQSILVPSYISAMPRDPDVSSPDNSVERVYTYQSLSRVGGSFSVCSSECSDYVLRTQLGSGTSTVLANDIDGTVGDVNCDDSLNYYCWISSK